MAAQVPDFMADLGIEECVAHCLAGDESAARAAAGPLDGMLAYMAAKHALSLKVREYATIWGESGVRLNVISPGRIETPMLDGVKAMKGASEQIAAQSLPLGRSAQPAEMAGPISFLLGPDASYVHGISMIVDGGADAILRPSAL